MIERTISSIHARIRILPFTWLHLVRFSIMVSTQVSLLGVWSSREANDGDDRVADEESQNPVPWPGWSSGQRDTWSPRPSPGGRSRGYAGTAAQAPAGGCDRTGQLGAAGCLASAVLRRIRVKVVSTTDRQVSNATELPLAVHSPSEGRRVALTLQNYLRDKSCAPRRPLQWTI
jgi:hypothetical protein